MMISGLTIEGYRLFLARPPIAWRRTKRGRLWQQGFDGNWRKMHQGRRWPFVTYEAAKDFASKVREGE